MTSREMLVDLLVLLPPGRNSEKRSDSASKTDNSLQHPLDRRARMSDIPNWHIVGDRFANSSCVVPCPCALP